MAELKCTSCGTDALARKNFVRFKCPNCGEVVIVRCSRCKTASNKYVCPNCSFSGP